jgi:hypothetical protein
MRKIGLYISLWVLGCFAALAMTAQVTYNFNFTPLSGFYQRWGVGNDRWQETSGSQIVSGYPNPTIYYRRFTVPEILDAAGNPYWSRFDSKINEAIEAHQKFGFRLFTMYAWPESDDFFNKTPTMSGVDGRTGNTVSARSAVPLEWHTAMQAGATKNWISESGDWVPNYNSTAFLTRFNAMHLTMANHLDTGKYKPTWSATPINYKDVIQYIDVSGFGTWGEWHSYASAPGNNVANYPPGTFPTVATFKSIIDAHKNNYPNYQLCIIINAFDAMRLPNTRIPAEIGVYAYQTRTNKGWMGRRIDHAGDDTGYDDYYLQLNNNSFNGYRLDTASDYRHRLAPFHGEPPGGPVYYNGIVQGLLPIQARKWHLASIGNGNYGQGNTPTGAGADSVRLAFSLMGYHLRLTGGNAVVSTNFTINLKWRNYGLTPTYDRWTVQYTLRNGAGTQVWQNNSSFDPYLFATEDGEVTKTDAYNMPGIAAGTYGLYVTVKDPTGYMTPLQLQINGRNTTDGSYFLSNVTIPSVTSNRPPVANAGSNVSITLPTSSTNLSGSLSSDPDGTVASYLWTQVSGPSTATNSSPTTANTTMGSLVAGTYVFNLHVVDNVGDVSDDQVQVIVNTAPNIAPVAQAGANLTIQLPVDSVLLNGLATDDIAVTSISWSEVSGPASYSIITPTNDTTKVKNLTEGTYVFRITVSDGSLTDTDDVTVIVLAAVIPPGTKKVWVWGRKF